MSKFPNLKDCSFNEGIGQLIRLRLRTRKLEAYQNAMLKIEDILKKLQHHLMITGHSDLHLPEKEYLYPLGQMNTIAKTVLSMESQTYEEIEKNEELKKFNL